MIFISRTVRNFPEGKTPWGGHRGREKNSKANIQGSIESDEKIVFGPPIGLDVAKEGLNSLRKISE